jgi:hypothetical protein
MALTIQGLFTGTTSGTQYVGPFTLVPNTAGNFEVLETLLTGGNTPITVPTWSVFAVIVPPSTNSTTILFKAVGGDTGFFISPSTPSVISYTAGANGFIYLDAASSIASPVTIIFC